METTKLRPEFINLAEAAHRLGVSTVEAERLIRAGALDARIFVTAASVDEFRKAAEDE